MWQKKTIKQSSKRLQKIRQAFNYIYKAKAQKISQAHKQNIAHNVYENMMQNVKFTKAKKTAALMLQFLNKKNSNGTVQIANYQ